MTGTKAQEGTGKGVLAIKQRFYSYKEIKRKNY
jgi:hypothetical protein